MALIFRLAGSIEKTLSAVRACLSSYEYMNYLQVVQVLVRTPKCAIYVRRLHSAGFCLSWSDPVLSFEAEAAEFDFEIVN